ncbi:hypothetical protein VXJ25_08080 [Olsenella sp. YH-ols2223]|uniref:Helix-turn-helix domain-containing protein n=1 Tax=Olsenella absiana TaxID=3115222 RepID=A0ABU7RBF0_9ACTN
MYTKEEREGILWEFHQSGMNAKRACEALPMFPTRDVLRRWLRLEAQGVYVAREMPDRPSRMHCSHKWGDRAGRGGARRW